MKPLPAHIRQAEPFMSFLGDLAALGVQPVAQGGRRFAVIAARSNPRWWLLPLNNRRAAAAGLEMLQPVTHVARLAKGVARTLARFGLHRLVGRGQIRLSDPADLPDVQAAFGGRAAHVACFTGTDGPHRKTALQVMDQSGAILGYAKLSRAAHLRPYLRNEADMLRRVAGMGLRSVDVPAVLGFRDNKAVTLLITDSVKSAAHAATLVAGADHLAFLSELRARSQSMGAGALLDNLAAQAAALADLAGPEWGARFARVETALRPQAADIPLCTVHGDFTPWNIFVQGGRLYVFDWEYARAAWPVGFDLAHFVLSTTPPQAQPERLPELLGTLANAQFDGNRAEAARALLLSLCCHALFYLARLAEAERPLPDWTDGPARAAMIDRLLTEETAL